MGLGRSWAPFGTGLGRAGVSFGRCWVLSGRFLTFKTELSLSIGPRWAPRHFLDQFWMDFGRVWKGLGRIWESIGGVWALKMEAFASHGRLLSILRVPCCLTLCYRNPRVPRLRPAERHNYFIMNPTIFPSGPWQFCKCGQLCQLP